MADTTAKAEDGAQRRPGYKSWKKKYRKMRIAFEQRMQVGEDIFKQEAKATATVKRLAVENDRLLGILLDINSSAQIPPEKRVNISLDTLDSNGQTLDFDDDSSQQAAAKSLREMLAEIPHLDYEATKESIPSLAAELDKAPDETYPTHFLSPDDVDNYLHDVDSRLDPESHIPTLAPLAHPTDHPPLHPLLRNPNSSTSWLRRHAPQIFLQGHEGDTHADGDDDGGHGPHGGAGSRKSRGGARGTDRGGRGGSTRGKRASTAASRATNADKGTPTAATDWDASMDDDGDYGATPVPKGKRKRDEEPGSKAKAGSASRPTKKKRKSEASEATPTAKRAKKEAAAAGGDGED